ncbi:MAG: hypothetical protein ABJ360_22315 [Roseobacter sp.]
MAVFDASRSNIGTAADAPSKATLKKNYESIGLRTGILLRRLAVIRMQGSLFCQMPKM